MLFNNKQGKETMKVIILLIQILQAQASFATCISTTPRNPGPFSPKQLIEQGTLYKKNFLKRAMLCYQEALSSNPKPKEEVRAQSGIVSVLREQRTKLISEKPTEEKLISDRFLRFQNNLLATNKAIERLMVLLTKTSIERGTKDSILREIDSFVQSFRRFTITKNTSTSCELTGIAGINKEKKLALTSAKHMIRHATGNVTMVILPTITFHVDTNTKGRFAVRLPRPTTEDIQPVCSITSLYTKKALEQTKNCVLDLTKITSIFLLPKIPLPKPRQFPWQEVGITAGAMAAIAIGIGLFVHYKDAQQPTVRDQVIFSFR